MYYNWRTHLIDKINWPCSCIIVVCSQDIYPNVIYDEVNVLWKDKSIFVRVNKIHWMIINDVWSVPFYGQDACWNNVSILFRLKITGVLHFLPQISTFCALSQNNQYLLENYTSDVWYSAHETRKWHWIVTKQSGFSVMGQNNQNDVLIIYTRTA